MSSTAQEALRLLVTAFEEHLAAVVARRGDEDVAVDDAYDRLAEAFDRYEAVLDVEHGESLPMLLDDEDSDEADDGDDVDIDPHAEEDDLDDDLEEFRLD